LRSITSQLITTSSKIKIAIFISGFLAKTRDAVLLSEAVKAPLTYSALDTNATTVLAGLGASYKGIAQTVLFASAGVEADTNMANGTYSATGVTGLTAINFNSNPVRTRERSRYVTEYVRVLQRV
jgi:hypothetical protein